MPIDKITRQLSQLEKLNFMTYVPRNDKPNIQFLTERMDSKYFHLSDDIYKNRKDDAARRAQAVIDFVNNDRDCRSVQLLRYFGEDIKKTCGKCDVCSSKNKMSINDKEYQEISENIVRELREKESDVYEILKTVKEHHEEKVLTTIKWMLDNNIIKQDNDGLLRL